MTVHTVGSEVWQIDYCRGSLDCYTGYLPRDQQPTPEEHWKAHLVSYRVEKQTDKRVYFTDGYNGRRYLVDRAVLEANGNAYCAKLRTFVYAAEPPMPELPGRRKPARFAAGRSWFLVAATCTYEASYLLVALDETQAALAQYLAEALMANALGGAPGVYVVPVADAHTYDLNSAVVIDPPAAGVPSMTTNGV